MIIYKVTNTLTGHVYIGQTTRDLEVRKGEHCYGQDGVGYFGKALRKYDKSVFLWEVIDTAESLQELNEKEIFWIKHFNCLEPNGYNLCPGGFGIPMTAAIKKRISTTLSGRTLSKEHVEKIRMANLGKKRAPTTVIHRRYTISEEGRKNMQAAAAIRNADPIKRAKQSAKLSGKPLSEEHKKKIGEGNRGRVMNPEYVEKMKLRRASDDTKMKMSLAKKGKAPSAKCLQNSILARTGTHLSEETRRKIGEANRKIWERKNN